MTFQENLFFQDLMIFHDRGNPVLTVYPNLYLRNQVSNHGGTQQQGLTVVNPVFENISRKRGSFCNGLGYCLTFSPSDES